MHALSFHAFSNVARDPRWGRSLETFAEDPGLIAALGVAYVDGLQRGLPANASAAASGFLKIMAVPKHLGAYSVECYNASGGANSYPRCPTYRSSFNAVVDETDLQETYYPGWEAAVRDAHAQGVMCSYNAINGVPACSNGDLLQTALVDDWGLGDGFVISDADAVAQIVPGAPQDGFDKGHNFVPSLYEAAIAALKNGTTISLEDAGGAAFTGQLLAALGKGRITMAELRAAAARALAPRFRVGLYDPVETVPWNSIPASVIESEAHHNLARRAAAESCVLLTNKGGVLPLQPPSEGGPATIAVVGPAANCTDCLINRYSGHPTRSTSIFQGVATHAADAGATALFGGATSSDTAINTVKHSDVAIVVLTPTAEGESHDREEIGFPADQLEFLEQLLATGTPLIVCIVGGGAVDSSFAVEHAAAVIDAGIPGMEGGAGLADVLFGSENPSGVLARTVYRESWVNASEFLDMAMRTPPGRGHRYLTQAATANHVLFEFGFGLSYSTWEASLLSSLPATISAGQLAAGMNVTVAVKIRNTGNHTGARVVHLLLSRELPASAEQWPNSWLPRLGFAKLHAVAPTEVQTATLTLTARDFSRWDQTTKAWTVRTGGFTFRVRDCAAEIAGKILVSP